MQIRIVRRLSQLHMKLRKPDWKSLVRLILQGDPKMEIGFFEEELGRGELGAGIPEKSARVRREIRELGTSF